MEKQGSDSLSWCFEKKISPGLYLKNSHGYTECRGRARPRVHGETGQDGHHTDAGLRCGALNALFATQSGRG